MYRGQNSGNSNINSYNHNQNSCRGRGSLRRRGRGHGQSRVRNPNISNGQNNRSSEDTVHTFYSYALKNIIGSPKAINDTGAWVSVFGKNTLDNAMKQLGISEISDASPILNNHRFGNQDIESATILVVKVPF